MRVLLLAALVISGCGNSIGDSCSQSTDCSTDGDRICDSASPGGYCTQEGCDFGTCPEEAVCVRFYPVTQLTMASCTPGEEGTCSLDEICVIGGYCAPRSTERRFCMKKCGGAGDCRGEYECRDEERMALHGGEPVPDPDDPDGDGGELQGFCAPAKPCTADADCDLGDRCNLSKRRCDQP